MTGHHADPGGLWGARPTGGWRKWPKPSLSWGMSTWLQLEKEPSIAPPFLFPLQITNIIPKLCSWALLFLDVKNILTRRRGFVGSSPREETYPSHHFGKQFSVTSQRHFSDCPSFLLKINLGRFCNMTWRFTVQILSCEAPVKPVLWLSWEVLTKEQNVLVKMCTGRRGNVSRNT